MTQTAPYKEVILTALLAGKEIMEVYSNDILVAEKEDKSPLTEADARAHRIIASALAKTGLPILSEEGKTIPFEERKSWKQFWMVDPLDGTKEFIKRNGEFTVNIALIEGGRPVWGVVYAPALKTLFWGGETTASMMAENVDTEANWEWVMEKAQVISTKHMDQPYKVVGSRSHASPETEAFVEELKTKHGELAFVSMGSSLKICLVAAGKAQIYPRFAPTMEWDTAAGHAVLVGAGGAMRKHNELTPLAYNKENLLNPWFIAQADKG